MGIWDVIYLIVLLIGVTFGLMLVTNTIVRVLGEEHRKNGTHDVELTDKLFKKIIDLVKEGIREVKNIDKEDNCDTYKDFLRRTSDKKLFEDHIIK